MAVGAGLAAPERSMPQRNLRKLEKQERPAKNRPFRSSSVDEFNR
jgi:hypothetical protein